MIQALMKHPRIAAAVTRLQLTDDAARKLLELCTALPRLHAYYMHETAPEANKRRVKLASRMRETADAIDADPDADYYPRYGGVDGTEPRVGDWPGNDHEMSLADWLRDCAKHLEQVNYSVPPLTSRREHKNLKSFVMRGVSFHVQMMKQDDRAHNVETAMIASVVLGEEVTPNAVSAARCKYRRKYWPREQ